MFWRQKRTGRAREGAAGPVLIQRPAGAPRPEAARLAMRGLAGAAGEKALMVRLLSAAPAGTNPLPVLERGAAPPSASSASAASAAAPAAEDRRGMWSVAQSEHEYEHEGGATWRTSGPR